MTKPRLTAYLSRSVADRLELACKRPGANKSALVEKALDRLLNPERDQQGEAALIRRLDRMSKQLGEINRNQQIVVESLALFVRYYLTITPPLPKSEQEPARSLGNQRFEFFIAQVGKRLAGGQTIVSEVLERIVAHDPDLFARDLDETQMMPKQRDPRGEAPAPNRKSHASPAPGASNSESEGDRFSIALKKSVASPCFSKLLVANSTGFLAIYSNPFGAGAATAALQISGMPNIGRQQSTD